MSFLSCDSANIALLKSVSLLDLMIACAHAFICAFATTHPCEIYLLAERLKAIALISYRQCDLAHDSYTSYMFLKTWSPS